VEDLLDESIKQLQEYAKDEPVTPDPEGRPDGPPSRTLHRALEILGSREELRRALWLTSAELDDYLGGKKPVPNAIFLAALDIVAGRRKPSAS
jgi:hypothetical protein